MLGGTECVVGVDATLPRLYPLRVLFFDTTHHLLLPFFIRYELYGIA